MKGIELPINILVVVAIAVIVLLGMIALYFTGWSPFGSSVGVESIKNMACIDYTRNNNCAPDPSNLGVNYDADADGVVENQDCDPVAGTTCEDNLQVFTDTFYGCNGVVNCVRRLCGCAGY